MAKEIPVGVKIIAVLCYVTSISVLVFAIYGFVRLMIDVPSMANDLKAGGLSWLVLFIGIFIILVLIAFSVLGFFIARGLWKGRGWARIAAIILACFVIFIVIISIAGSILITEIVRDTGGNKIIGFMINLIVLIINLIIGLYLLFNKDVKNAFS